eukprot:TRINITY_DN4998_c0_g2_i1.p1 TRINITY_DN4998_c0_g2~~TRINITY_DN4998_c0_g2_i1.p1  ORF type:complete len:102 (+),score=2.61 TRINITY_DN4998_c0_g2_i1:1-306(+)
MHMEVHRASTASEMFANVSSKYIVCDAGAHGTATDEKFVADNASSIEFVRRHQRPGSRDRGIDAAVWRRTRHGLRACGGTVKVELRRQPRGTTTTSRSSPL